MEETTMFIGLDVHKATIAVAIAEGGRREAARYFGEIENTPAALSKLAKKYGRVNARLSFCYEAGPCGYGVHRHLVGLGHGGATTRRSGLTKTGNAEARRVMVEAAWSYRLPARVGRILLDRLEGLAVEIRDIAWKAQGSGCAPATGASPPRASHSRSSWPRSPANWWASPGLSPVRSPPRRPPDGPIHRNQQQRSHAKPVRITDAQGATVRRTSGHAMSRIRPTLDLRQGQLRQGQLHDEPGSCGSQPAHQR
jgi:hypothetical protein